MPISGLREAVMADNTTVRSYPFGPIHALEIDPMYFWLQDHEPLARVKLPYGDRDQFRDWVGAFMSVTAVTVEQRGEYIGQLAGYLADLAAQRRRQPTDDLLGALVIASDEGDRLTEDEVVQLTVVLLAAGY